MRVFRWQKIREYMSKDREHNAEGVHHWIGMKLSSAMLVPLGIWFVYSILQLAGASHAAALAWVTTPPNAIVLLLFLGLGLYHSAGGLEVVVGDYVHTPWRKNAILITSTVVHLVLGALALVSVLMIAVKQ